MLGAGLRMIKTVSFLGAELAVDAGRVVSLDDLFDIEPRQFRRLLLTFDHSIQGRIPEILGDDEEERVDTLIRILRGTSDADMAALIRSLQVALGRLQDERRRALAARGEP